MQHKNAESSSGAKPSKTDIAERIRRGNWAYVRIVVDTAREPFVVLDEGLRVLAANESFYRTFQVERTETEGSLIYELGNKQWDIPDLRKLLEDILPQNTFFEGFKVTHEFPHIGRKVMLLNARRTCFDNASSRFLLPIILLSIEDVTEMIDVAEKLAVHAAEFEVAVTSQMRDMESRVAALERLP